MTTVVEVLARRRWLGIGLAIAVELALLVPLALASPSTAVGLPAAVAAAIGGTVAVVFGPLAGILVALVGAVVFGTIEGWGTGQLLALVVWPGIVGAAGLVGRVVQRQRRALAELVASQERERQRLALELHDETAQVLAAVLLTLRQVEQAGSAADVSAAAADARELLRPAIEGIRALAVELRPKVLDDFGLAPAVTRLAEGFAERTGVPVEVDSRLAGERLPREVEVTAYRAFEEVLVILGGSAGSGGIHVGIEEVAGALRLDVARGATPSSGRANGRAVQVDLTGLRERLRLVGGRVATGAAGAGTRIRVEIPLRG
jgi:signal transduction histidine kinase